MYNDCVNPQTKILNWGKANSDGNGQLTKVDWSRLFACKSTTRKWGAFKNV